MNSNRKAFVRADWSIWSPRAIPLPAIPSACRRISICTVCKERCYDLRRTLLKNIADNCDYPNLEFVVLNYNSGDELHDFILSDDLAPYLRSGLIRYLVTREPQYYSTSHSRNVAFKNSTGEIVTNVDADNFTGVGFASYLNRLADICPQRALFTKSKWRNHGRIGMFKCDFQALGGYDEDLEGYGWEDYSLMGRAMRSGFTLMWWLTSKQKFSERLTTPKEFVSTNMKCTDWRHTERCNRDATLAKIESGNLVANSGRDWGAVNDLVIIGAN